MKNRTKKKETAGKFVFIEKGFICDDTAFICQTYEQAERYYDEHKKNAMDNGYTTEIYIAEIKKEFKR